MRKINPNLIKLAKQTCNPDLPVPNLDEIAEPQIEAPNLEGFIYVPSIGLYVAKERTLHGKDWYKTHQALHEQGQQMLTIRQFVEFLKYLKENPNSESQQILDDILTVRDPWRAEWLDAKFEGKNGLHINYNHRIINGQLQPQNSEPLEECLMEDKTPGIDLNYWLNNATSQGLPPKNIPNREIYYWYPRADYVAWFGADSDRADLGCYGDPESSDSALGVRPARENLR